MPADPITAELWIDGERFADTAADWVAGRPVALADVDLRWGRETTVDQPETSTMTFRVVDRGGGSGLLDELEVGRPVQLWARGNINPTADDYYDAQVDGGFEGAALGPPGNHAHLWAVSGSPVSTLTVAAGSPGGEGAHVLDLDTRAALVAVTAGDVVSIPPAPMNDPEPWLDLPQLSPGQAWRVDVAALRVGKGMQVVLRGRTYSGPTGNPAGDGYVDTGATIVGTGAFEHVSAAATAAAGDVNVWLGTSIRVVSWLAWSGAAGSWAAQPAADTWRTYDGVVIDQVGVLAPQTAALRGVVTFAGRISDVRLEHTADDEWTATATAVDLLAELANTYVGDEPWPAEPVPARIDRIYTAAGITGNIELVTDDTISSHTVSWRDVDHQSAAALLTEQAAGIDFVMWPASASTTVPYLWFEDPALREVVGGLALDPGSGYVEITAGASHRPAGKTALDGCDVLADDVRFVRDVSDVLTIVDAYWLEQTVDELGLEAPTERIVTVVDAPAKALHGERRIGISTMTTAAAEATDIANGVLLRTRQPQWRTEGLTWDMNVTPPPRGAKTVEALDLLDGTIRLGRGIVVESVQWPGGEAIGAYLDGGHYVYDGAWRLELLTSPTAGFGISDSADWDDLDPTWEWVQMHPDLAWVDLWGVTGPNAAELEPSR